jgi:hypothetical protein
MSKKELDVVVDELIEIPIDEVEVITDELGWDYVWIPGSWEREPSEWVWAKGEWKKPPHKHARWVGGHWNYKAEKWHWNCGSWVSLFDGYAGYIVDEYIDIPGVLSETRPERPSHEHHWVAGYWEWDGKWIWKRGHWTLKPHPKADWVTGHWDVYGKHGWRWIAGHWNVR